MEDAEPHPCISRTVGSPTGEVMGGGYHPKKALGAREGSGGYLGEEEVGGMRRTTKRGVAARKRHPRTPWKHLPPFFNPSPKTFQPFASPKTLPTPSKNTPPPGTHPTAGARATAPRSPGSFNAGAGVCAEHPTRGPPAPPHDITSPAAHWLSAAAASDWARVCANRVPAR